MISTTICKYVHFITIITIVSGYAHELNRGKVLQDTMTDLTHYPGLQYFPSRNAKRMTMDENTRARGAWGQMNPQYYQDPRQSQYQNQYYQNMQAAGYQYGTSTEVPTSPGGAVINIFKQLKPGAGGVVTTPPNQEADVDGGVYHPQTPQNKKKVKVLICRLQQDRN